MKKPRVVSGAGFKQGEAASSESSESVKSDAASKQLPASATEPAAAKADEKVDPMLSVEPTESEKFSASEVCSPFAPSYYTASDLAGKTIQSEVATNLQSKKESGEPEESTPIPPVQIPVPPKPKKKPRIIATYDYSLLTQKEQKD